MSTRTDRIDDWLIRYRLVVIALTHGGIFAFSIWFAMALRLDFTFPETYAKLLVAIVPIFVIVKSATFFALRQYSGWWRYVSLTDLIGTVQASFVGMLVAATVVVIAGIREFPRSVFILDLFVTILTLSGARVAIRLFRERFAPQDTVRVDAIRVLVVGTGLTAESLVRESIRNPAVAIHVVGIVSPDARLVGTRMLATPIRGSIGDIARLCREHAADEVVIALEAGAGDVIREVVTACASADVKHRVLPPTDALLQGNVTVSRIRDVSLQDLLGRQPVVIDNEEIARVVSGNAVLVTGAGGSIGSELCRQIASFGPGRLILLEQAENPLFHLERELRIAYPELDIVPFIADVFEATRLRGAMMRFRPALVLHAAAHKHVPLMEKNPTEAIKNNIIGTKNVLDAAAAAKVDVCVLISTDKAVNPTSVMGASKRIAEMLCQSYASESETRFAAVRFGNVLGSNGSVIPIFQEQIQRGGPVTVTHPDMERFFMTIPEASRLVLQAATFASAGEIFVLDMGEPVKIVNVAKDLIRLSGLEPDEDIKIVFSGIRPGEKLFEELSTDAEETVRTEHQQIFRSCVEAMDRDTVVYAAEQLLRFAKQGAKPQDTRATLFQTLEALERRESAEALKLLPSNVVPFRDSAAGL